MKNCLDELAQEIDHETDCIQAWQVERDDNTLRAGTPSCVQAVSTVVTQEGTEFIDGE
jgi:hypothetical protein